MIADFLVVAGFLTTMAFKKKTIDNNQREKIRYYNITILQYCNITIQQYDDNTRLKYYNITIL